MNQNMDTLSYLENDLPINKIINGMWQVSGAHGKIDRNRAIDAMMSYVDKGFLTWDLADHYGPAEDFVKIFRERLVKEGKKEVLSNLKFFTKWVPHPQKITKDIVKKAIDVSRKRMGMKALDMVQFHWWDYNNKEYLKAMEFLDELREEGIIRALGITNFDTQHLKEFLDLGIKVISNQVQYSLIDRRPERFMANLCSKYNIKLLTYGTLGGGLISKRFLNKPEPNYSQLNTASLNKYYNMVRKWGDWELFQELLNVLNELAIKYEVSLANIAIRYVLERDYVGGAIIGTRLGISEHIVENSKVFKFSLDKHDYEEIKAVLSNSSDLLEIIGDCGDEYR